MRPSRSPLVGISITLVGVVTTVVASGVTLGAQGIGYMFLAGAVVAFALHTVYAERYAHASDMDKTVVMIVAGALVFCTMAVADHARADSLAALLTLPVTRPDFAAAVIYLALGCTLGAFFLQNYAISSLGANRFGACRAVSRLSGLRPRRRGVRAEAASVQSPRG